MTSGQRPTESRTGSSARVDATLYEAFPLYVSSPPARFTLFEHEIRAIVDDVRADEGRHIAWETRRWWFLTPGGFALGCAVGAISLAAGNQGLSLPAVILWVLTAVFITAGGFVWFFAWHQAGGVKRQAPETTDGIIRRLKHERADHLTFLSGSLETGVAPAGVTARAPPVEETLYVRE